VRVADNLLQRALILVNGPVIHKDHIQFELANEGHLTAEAPVVTIKPPAMDVPSSNSLARSLDETERDLILDALRTGQGSRREVAERLGISQRTLRYKLARLREAGVDVPAA
jgi:two-component system, response regulator FlrC